jgi:hypothetical protein
MIAKLCECGCGEPTMLAKQTIRSRGLVKGQPNRFLPGHHAFKSGPRHREEDHGYETPCWVWTRALSTAGYGWWYDRVTKRVCPAHRLMYEREVGPIPAGHELHHRCNVPACVRLSHLQLVTFAEHRRITWAAKPFCPQGHPFDDVNTIVRPDGSRTCLTCRRDRGREYMRCKRAEARAAI